MAWPLTNLASVYASQGKYGEAEGLYRRALAIREQALGANHPEVANSLDGLASVYQMQGKYGEAEGVYTRALAIKEKALGASHPDVAKTLNNLALLQSRRGDIGKALSWSRKTTAAVITHAGTEAAGTRQTGETAGLLEQRGQYFLRGEECERLAVEIFPIFGKSSAAIQAARWCVQRSIVWVRS